MKKVNWLLIGLILIGFILGTLIAQVIPNTFLSYGQTFGLNTPVELDLGFLILTFGLRLNFTIAGILGVILAFVIYKFIR